MVVCFSISFPAALYLCKWHLLRELHHLALLDQKLFSGTRVPHWHLFFPLKPHSLPQHGAHGKGRKRCIPPKILRLGQILFSLFTLLPESLNHTGHRSWFALKATISWNTLLFFYLSHWTPVRLLNCLGQAYIQCFAPFFRNSNEEDSLSCSFNRSEGDKKTFEKVCYSGKNHLERQRIQPFASATIVVLNSLS